MADLFAPLSFSRGPAMKNRFMLAPMTNQQSHADGRLSPEEFDWLTRRAEGGFGLVMTCAAHVQPAGQGFPGQLGAFADDLVEGLAHLAAGIRERGALSSLQLHHAGYRAPSALVGTPVCPSDHEETGARGLTLDEVRQLRDDFIAGARRAEGAGFDGVEIHGAHGYILAEFLSPEVNRRTDHYGGDAANRARLILEIIDGIRAQSRSDFQIGLRLSPERYAQRLDEVLALAGRVMADGKIDYLDMSLWDVAKEPEDERFRGRSLLSYFTELDRGSVRLGAAGKIMTGTAAASVLDAGCDFVSIGRAAILRHDFPARVREQHDFASPSLPVSTAHLAGESVSPSFVDYLRTWPDFVAQPTSGFGR
ncbi:putative NADH-dependent flavin oxidoreductase YqiG [Sphingomonas sp. DBB INV C78]|uniref:NADH:flavin oxidoreductase n=1 Tax=Sphingomonas sp. DBB INV C78 TaxID=3349434 RepID=UPI0036D3A120